MPVRRGAATARATTPPWRRRRSRASTISRSSACTSGASGVVRVAHVAGIGADPVADGAEDAAADAGGLEDRRDQVSGRRLAVCAGDSDHLHLAARVAGRTPPPGAPARGGRRRRSPTAPRRPAVASARTRPPTAPRSIACSRERRAVRVLPPFERHEQRCRRHRTRVVGDAADRARPSPSARQRIVCRAIRPRAARRVKLGPGQLARTGSAPCAGERSEREPADAAGFERRRQAPGPATRRSRRRTSRAFMPDLSSASAPLRARPCRAGPAPCRRPSTTTRYDRRRRRGVAAVDGFARASRRATSTGGAGLIVRRDAEIAQRRLRQCAGRSARTPCRRDRRSDRAASR